VSRVQREVDVRSPTERPSATTSQAQVLDGWKGRPGGPAGGSSESRGEPEPGGEGSRSLTCPSWPTSRRRITSA
jgi:hypothetical protein